MVALLLWVRRLQHELPVLCWASECWWLNCQMPVQLMRYCWPAPVDSDEHKRWLSRSLKSKQSRDLESSAHLAALCGPIIVRV